MIPPVPLSISISPLPSYPGFTVGKPPPIEGAGITDASTVGGVTNGRIYPLVFPSKVITRSSSNVGLIRFTSPSLVNINSKVTSK